MFQQTQNNPCVIGNPSCNNPAGFGFTVNFSNDNGAREQFFLVSSDALPAPVPEPATLVLRGTTMAGLGLVGRRWRRAR